MESLAELMKQAGIDQWGICDFSEALPLLEVRSKSRIPPGCKRILVLLFGYYVGDYPNRNVSRYALVDDYHIVIRAKLEKVVKKLQETYTGEVFIPFVDSSPIAEVRAARLAGLGDVGRNGQLLNPVYGSYCFIAEVVTTAALPTTNHAALRLCTGCGDCLAVCPTGALSESGFLRDCCRSHITQKKGELSGWERAQVKAGGLLWGCDLCTDVCPVNRSASQSRVPEFYQDIAPNAGETNLGRLCATKAYGWRGEQVLLRNLRILQEDG